MGLDCHKSNLRFVIGKIYIGFISFSLYFSKLFLLTLKYIKRRDRLGSGDAIIDTRFCMVDGTDCSIQDRTSFDSKWFSHKFHGAGLWYKISVRHETGNIVRVYSPFLFGAWPKLKVFQKNMVSFLNDNKLVVADCRYTHVLCVTSNNVDLLDQRLHACICARHEICNMRLKRFKILSHLFLHSV